MGSEAFLGLKRIYGAIRRGAFRSVGDMQNIFELQVHLAFDEEAKRWYIAESDIPGLWLEADSPSELIERIKLAAPEMIELNHAEIFAACVERQKQKDGGVVDEKAEPFIRPVFDSPMKLAYA